MASRGSGMRISMNNSYPNFVIGTDKSFSARLLGIVGALLLDFCTLVLAYWNVIGEFEAIIVLLVLFLGTVLSVISYIRFWFGAKKIKEDNEDAKLTVVLIPVITGLILLNSIFMVFPYLVDSDFSIFVDIAISILELLTVYILSKAIIKCTLREAKKEMLKIGEKNNIIVAVPFLLTSLSKIISILVRSNAELMFALTIAAYVLAIVADVLFLYFLSRARRSIEDH